MWYKNKSKRNEDSSSLSITVFSPCLPHTDTYIIYLQPEGSALSSSWDNPTMSVHVLGAPSPQRPSSGCSYAVISLVPSDPGVAPYAPWNLLSILMTEHLFSMCLCPSSFPWGTGTLFWPLDHSWEPSNQVFQLTSMETELCSLAELCSDNSHHSTCYLCLPGAYCTLLEILTKTVQGR